jgi:hypothetical protein
LEHNNLDHPHTGDEITGLYAFAKKKGNDVDWQYIGISRTIKRRFRGHAERIPAFFRNILNRLFIKRADKKHFRPEVNTIRLRLKKNINFAPIYDNGSSLCRECTTEKIESMLTNKAEMEAYIRRGVSEIHWREKKTSHFELLTQILGSSYSEMLRNIIKKVTERYNESAFLNVVNGVDNSVQEPYKIYRIPESRKAVICKVVSLRAEKLSTLVK